MNKHGRVGGGWYSSVLLEPQESVQLELDATQNECAGKLILTTQRIIWLPSVLCESQLVPWINFELNTVNGASAIYPAHAAGADRYLSITIADDITFLFTLADPEAVSGYINRLLHA